MNEKFLKYSARLITSVLNPFIVPTLGLLLIMGYIPGVDYFSFKLKTVLVAVMFLSTCFIPLTFIALGNIHKGWKVESNHYFDRAMPYIFTGLSAFLGSQFLGKLPIPGIFRALLLGICILMIVSIIAAIKWKIAEHTLALGGLWGTLLALNFKFGMNLIWLVVVVILVSGVVGTSRIYLEKDSPCRVYSSYLTGMVCMFLILTFI